LNACACRKLDPRILVMQSAKGWSTEYEANRLDGARNRCVLVQGQVRTRLIVVIQIRPQQWHSPKTITRSMHSRRIDPISRSA